MMERPKGYKNPPQEHQWEPGQSGNPKGRPKGARNTLTELERLLERNHTFRSVDGEEMKINTKTAILHATVRKAIHGDLRAVHILLPYMLKIDEHNE